MWFLRTPFWLGIVGLIFLYQGYIHVARTHEEVVSLRCGSPGLAEANHIRLGWCVVEDAFSIQNHYRPQGHHWLVLRAPGATEISAVISIARGSDEEAALAIQSVERELASGELELFRNNNNGEDDVFRLVPELESAPFVGTRQAPEERLATGNGAIWLGGVLLLFDAIRSSLLLIWALRRYV